MADRLGGPQACAFPIPPAIGPPPAVSGLSGGRVGAGRRSAMKLIVGLGNPTAQYEKTRHNVGFRAAERFAAAHRIALDGRKWNAVLGSGEAGGEKVVVLLPQTFMNASGEAAGPAMRFYKVPIEDVVALHD